MDTMAEPACHTANKKPAIATVIIVVGNRLFQQIQGSKALRKGGWPLANQLYILDSRGRVMTAAQQPPGCLCPMKTL